MTEPERLRRGKEFQRVVQDDFEKNSRGGCVTREAVVSLARSKKTGSKSGRADILIAEIGDGDFVTVLEIKATNWDRIKPKNLKKNLWRHQHQLFSYIEKFLGVDKIAVCPGIIYPRPPRDIELRSAIESYLEEYGAPAYWYNEIRSD
jgi:hypothetical protein